MNTFLRNNIALIAMLALITLGIACGAPDSEVAQEVVADPISAGDSPSSDSPTTVTTEDGDSASAVDALKAAANSQGIYVGEVPDGFPLQFIPLFPGGEIERSALQDGEATLLQVVPASKEDVLTHYRKFYDGLNWQRSEPITVAGRTMAGFSGGGAQVDMTMIDRGEGKTFVALALH